MVPASFRVPVLCGIHFDIMTITNFTKKLVLSLAIVGMSAGPSIATGSDLLSGLKFDFWTTSSNVSVSHHRERGETPRNGKVECWYVTKSALYGQLLIRLLH